MRRADVESFLAGPSFAPLDRHFAVLVERLNGRESPELLLAAALVSQSRERADVCLDLAEIAENPLEADSRLQAPPLAQWRAVLQSASAVVGAPGEVKPLVLDARDRLYLRRYWWYEDQVATMLLRRCSEDEDLNTDDDLGLYARLKQLFPDGGQSINWQRVAAWVALRKKLCVITGGPGTGKTTTVVRILALLAEQARPKGLRFGIAAPTGKAAARLQESLRTQKAQLGDQFLAARDFPEEVKTIHRLLGSIPNSPYFRHHAKRPLPIDVLVVDEASMVDLALMAKLLAAVPPAARIILLGDKDQLASVEAGNVLGDLCADPEPNRFSPGLVRKFAEVSGTALPLRRESAPAIADGLVELETNYRFGPNSGIHQASRAVQRGDADSALTLLDPGATSADGSVVGRELPTRRNLKSALRDLVVQHYGAGLQIRDPLTALNQINRFRVFSAVREGPHGVLMLNAVIEEILSDSTLTRFGEWYPGRQILVTVNDYSLGLFNGDLGISLPDESGNARVWFPGGADCTARSVVPSRLPAHETAFALTVHKSQGSEFDEVLLVLPDRSNRVLSRELIYTGLTRARKRTEVWYDIAVFREAVARRTARASGLRDRLWG